MAHRLVDLLGEDFELFIDVADVEPGAGVISALQQATDEADVMLVLIGSQWFGKDPSGRRRADDGPGYWVTNEIATGLQRNMIVVPVLVDSAIMPGPEDLPSPIGGLAERQAARLNAESFTEDATLLRQAIEEAIQSARTEEVAEQIAALIRDGNNRQSGDRSASNGNPSEADF